jgi:hypothetical protein
MAGKTAAKKTTAKSGNGRRKRTVAKVAPELIQEDGQWYVVSGNKRLDVGRNERYAQRMLAELSE